MTVLTLPTAQTFVNLVIGVSTLGAVRGMDLATVKTALSIITGAHELSTALRKMGLQPLADRLSAEAIQRAEEWMVSPDHHAAAHDVVAYFEQSLTYAVPRPEDLADEALDAPRITELMLKRLTEDSCPLAPYYALGSLTRTFFEAVAIPVLTKALDDPAFVAKIEPDLWRRTLTLLEEINETGHELTPLLGNSRPK